MTKIKPIKPKFNKPLQKKIINSVSMLHRFFL